MKEDLSFTSSRPYSGLGLKTSQLSDLRCQWSMFLSVLYYGKTSVVQVPLGTWLTGNLLVLSLNLLTLNFPKFYFHAFFNWICLRQPFLDTLRAFMWTAITVLSHVISPLEQSNWCSQWRLLDYQQMVWHFRILIFFFFTHFLILSCPLQLEAGSYLPVHWYSAFHIQSDQKCLLITRVSE